MTRLSPQCCHIGALSRVSRAKGPVDGSAFVRYAKVRAQSAKDWRSNMSGHSQFKNIMHRKGAQDKRRAKVFTKIIRELTTAARTGLPDPAANPRLRAAVLAARQANMPKDTVDRAIKRGSGGGADEAYEEVRYEGYGPGGVAVIVEALTDNRNRTASEVRAAFTKSGGALGETN